MATLQELNVLASQGQANPTTVYNVQWKEGTTVHAKKMTGLELSAWSRQKYQDTYFQQQAQNLAAQQSQTTYYTSAPLSPSDPNWYAQQLSKSGGSSQPTFTPMPGGGLSTGYVGPGGPVSASPWVVSQATGYTSQQLQEQKRNVEFQMQYSDAFQGGPQIDLLQQSMMPGTYATTKTPATQFELYGHLKKPPKGEFSPTELEKSASLGSSIYEFGKGIEKVTGGRISSAGFEFLAGGVRAGEQITNILGAGYVLGEFIPGYNPAVEIQQSPYASAGFGLTTAAMFLGRPYKMADKALSGFQWPVEADQYSITVEGFYGVETKSPGFAGYRYTQELSPWRAEIVPKGKGVFEIRNMVTSQVKASGDVTSISKLSGWATKSRSEVFGEQLFATKEGWGSRLISSTAREEKIQLSRIFDIRGNYPGPGNLISGSVKFDLGDTGRLVRGYTKATENIAKSMAQITGKPYFEDRMISQVIGEMDYAGVFLNLKKAKKMPIEGIREADIFHRGKSVTSDSFDTFEWLLPKAEQATKTATKADVLVPAVTEVVQQPKTALGSVVKSVPATTSLFSASPPSSKIENIEKTISANLVSQAVNQSIKSVVTQKQKPISETVPKDRIYFTSEPKVISRQISKTINETIPKVATESIAKSMSKLISKSKVATKTRTITGFASPIPGGGPPPPPPMIPMFNAFKRPSFSFGSMPKLRKQKGSVHPLADYGSLTFAEAALFGKAKQLKPTKDIKKLYGRKLGTEQFMLTFPTKEMVRWK